MQFSNSKIYFMDNNKQSQKRDEKNSGKALLGKRHDDMPNDKNQHSNSGKKNMTEEDANRNPEKNIEISDDPEETERKIPRMKH
jgi:hypothetical protein